MPSVKEILKRNDMDLDISEIALSFEFEGDFIFTEKKRIRKQYRDYDKPIQYAWAYIFFSGNDRIMIVPEDPDYVLWYTAHGHFECLGNDGKLSIEK